MREAKIALENNGVSVSKLDVVIEVLLVVLLAFMPLVGGARKAWSEEVVIVLSSAIVICFLLKLVLHHDQHIIWSWAYVPVGIFLFIVVFQLIPLPTGLVSVISPNTVKLKSELLGDLPNADTILKSMSLSFYPNATKHDLRLLLSIAGVFIIVLNIFRHPKRIKRILMAIALIGGLVGLIALAQDIFGNGKIYWFLPNPHPKALSGPFTNHSHYGQFMNLSIGAAIGWIYVKLYNDFAGKKANVAVVLDYIRSPLARSIWLLVAVMGLNAATVFISLTRAGMGAMIIAASFTALLLSLRRSLKKYGWMFVLIALLAFTCILFIGFNEVYDRFAKVPGSYEARWQIIKDLRVSFVRFPLLGTGLGTHSVVYPMFQNINSTLLFAYAENEYCQIMEEVGLIGLITLIIFGISVWISYVRNIRATNLPICLAAYGLGFGLLAILIHSLSDYGQHLPANGFLSAIFCFLLLSLARQEKNLNRVNQTVRSFCNSKWSHIVIFLAVCSIFTWSCFSADKARIAEGHWKKALHIEEGLKDNNWQGTEAEYAELISHTETANRYQPENVKYQYALNLYQWYSITKTKDAVPKNTIISEDSMPLVRNLVSGLNKAVKICPTYGPTYSLTGQIEKFVFNDDSGIEKIRNGFRLAPCNPIACFVAGRLDVLEGKAADSIPKFEKAVKIDGGLFKDVINIYIHHLSRPHLALSAAGDDISRLRYVARVLEDMQYNDLAALGYMKVKVLLEEKCSQPDASGEDFALLAGMYVRQGENEKAIECYRNALKYNYSRIVWHLELARLLAETGQISKAINEAKICLRLRPGFKPAEKMIGKLCVLPEAVKKQNRDIP